MISREAWHREADERALSQAIRRMEESPSQETLLELLRLSVRQGTDLPDVVVDTYSREIHQLAMQSAEYAVHYYAWQLPGVGLGNLPVPPTPYDVLMDLPASILPVLNVKAYAKFGKTIEEGYVSRPRFQDQAALPLVISDNGFTYAHVQERPPGVDWPLQKFVRFVVEGGYTMVQSSFSSEPKPFYEKELESLNVTEDDLRSTGLTWLTTEERWRGQVTREVWVVWVDNMPPDSYGSLQRMVESA